jgi:hypothetical protein
LPLFARLGDAIRSLPPYAALVMLLVPLAVLEPLKLFAVYLLAEGHALSGILTLVGSYAAGIVLVERLFAICRDKLLTIRWFAVCYGLVVRVRTAALDWLHSTITWRVGMVVARRLRRVVLRLRLASLRKDNGEPI